jgi:type II secretory pathway pseudopilin PulG
MNLAANASRGYAMAALLIAMSVMAVLLTVALPTWRQTIQREREEELIFRGNQYARAIGLYQKKYANASPASLDVLIEQHYLRKKFKDPVSPNEDGEFQPLYAGAPTPGTGAGTGAGSGTVAGTTPTGRGIIGVASKNTSASIRVYNGHSQYNEWQFIPVQQSSRGGTGGQGSQQGGTGGQTGQGTQQQQRRP